MYSIVVVHFFFCSSLSLAALRPIRILLFVELGRVQKISTLYSQLLLEVWNVLAKKVLEYFWGLSYSIVTKYSEGIGYL